MVYPKHCGAVREMEKAKLLLIIKNVDVELAEKIQKLINEHNQEKERRKKGWIPINEKRDKSY